MPENTDKLLAEIQKHKQVNDVIDRAIVFAESVNAQAIVIGVFGSNCESNVMYSGSHRDLIFCLEFLRHEIDKTAFNRG